jgi:O-antigen/teichoic acid export membrane protein
VSSPAPATEAQPGPPQEPAPPATKEASNKDDLRVAGRNAITLAFSLIGTWSVALLIRFQLPRFLDPAAFGDFNFAEAFTALLFVTADLGIDVYVVKETSSRPEHASDFAGGILLIRTLLSFVLFGVMGLTLHLTHRTDEVQLTVLIYGVTQFVTLANASMAALLQAATTVRRLAVANVASKLVWGAGLAIVIYFHGSLPMLAVPLFISEVLKLLFLVPAVRSSTSLTLRVDWQMTKIALIASAPYFLNEGAVIVGNRLTASVLEFMDRPENGLYGLTVNLAGLAMLLAPLFEWVLMPLLARARERSEEEVYAIGRRAIEWLLVAIIPFTLFISLSADLLILPWPKYAAAAMSLRVLSLDFSLVYLAMLLSTLLIVVGRSWTVTLVSLGAIPMRGVMIVPLVKLCTAWLGPGGGAVGAALTEISGIGFTAIISFWLVGRRAFDRHAALQIGKSLVVAVLVTVAHFLMSPLGYWRLLIDVLLYVALAGAFRIIGIGEVRSFISLLANRRRK